MALKSERHETVVNPDEGIYVEMEQIMEVRYTSDDPDFHRPSEDFKDFQERVREIPENFCHKDRETTEQAVFFCLVCNCDLKSLKPLRDHVTGNKHIRKACDFKRKIMGIPNQPQNAPKVKNIKKSRPRVDIGLSLKTLLEGCGEPAIGLEYITEYINPKNEHDHRMYTCKLEGCKSAWGTSDDIFNHVKRPKHHKNFFRKMNPDDARVAGMTSADILTKAAEWEENEYPDGERDYSVIVQKRDYDEYMELRHRPDDWSEKKAALGIVGNRFNSNMEPLGSRKRKSTEPPPMFDPVSWKGWQPMPLEQATEESRSAMRRGVETVVDKVDNFKGKIGDDEHEEVLHYNGIYKQLLGMLSNELGQTETAGLIGELDRGMGELQTKLESEEIEMKEITKLMAELEEEINRYHSDRTTTKYNNIRSRMGTLTKKIIAFKPGRVENEEVKARHNNRLGNLWKEFETRSDSMVEILEQQMGASGREGEAVTSSGGTQGRGDDRKGEARKTAVEKYKTDLTKHVKTLLECNYAGKFVQDEASRYATYLVKEKYLNAEVNQFTKKGAPWSEFKLTEKTKEAVKKHLDSKMSKYKAGDVNKV